MTELSDELLVAYVDGQLARDQSKAVERVLEQDEVAAQRVESMRVAHARLESAFDAMLENDFTELARQPEQADAAPIQLVSDLWRNVRQGGAMAVLGGAFCLVLAGAVTGYALRGAPDASALVPEAGVPVVTGALARRDWQEDLIIAHGLFGRESLAVGLEAQGNVDLIRFHLANAIGAEIQIPDLRAAGLAFKRAQLLNRDGNAIAQLAYLPAVGDPLALYALWDKGPDATAVTRQIDGVAAAEWRQRNITYLLIARMDMAQLEPLAANVRQQVADGNSLSSELAVPPSAADARRIAVDPSPAEVEAQTVPQPAPGDWQPTPN